MNYSVFGSFQWIRVDANILKTMTRKTEKKKIVFARVDRARIWSGCFAGVLPLKEPVDISLL